jgi:hypothetical protein
MTKLVPLTLVRCRRGRSECRERIRGRWNLRQRQGLSEQRVAAVDAEQRHHGHEPGNLRFLCR